MNIAHLLPCSASFPLKKHNGRYEWVLRLASAQAKRGHTVTIYTGPSRPGLLPGLALRSLSESPGDRTANNTALFKMAFSDNKHQIFHSHFDSLHYELADQTAKPVVVTQHWFPTAEIVTAVPLNTHRNVIAVPVTRCMAAADRQLGIPATDVIYHGINLELFRPLYSVRNDRLLFVGRITPQKGVRQAVAAARNANLPLDIVGKINRADQAYWETILPFADGQLIKYHGAKSQTEVAAMMARARALLFLPQAAEAFGQTIIEAQACGTPVILNDLGANSELVKDGITGRVIADSSDLRRAYDETATFDPHACRAFAEHFSLSNMVQAYDNLYARLVSVRRSPPARTPSTQ